MKQPQESYQEAKAKSILYAVQDAEGCEADQYSWSGKRDYQTAYSECELFVTGSLSVKRFTHPDGAARNHAILWAALDKKAIQGNHVNKLITGK